MSYSILVLEEIEASENKPIRKHCTELTLSYKNIIMDNYKIDLTQKLKVYIEVILLGR